MSNTELLLSPNDIFAIYRLPNTSETVLIKQSTDKIFVFNEPQLKDKGFVFYPFDNNMHTAIFIKADKIYKNLTFKFRISSINNEIDKTKNEYLIKANEFIEATKTTFRKIIFSRTKTIENNEISIEEIFSKLSSKYKNAMVFLINHPKAGTWMGATPETLLNIHNGSANTIALAGTQFTKTSENIVWKHKEQEEQKAVMDFIEKVLSKNNLEFNQKGPFTKIAAKNNNGYLSHIATEYNFKINSNIFDLIKQLHPTPAVSGLPKQESIEFINKNEGYDREYYTGFLGPINITSINSIQLFVNLRIMKVFKNKFKLFIGGGFNSDSIAKDEWQETENKAKTLAEIIKSVQNKKSR